MTTVEWFAFAVVLAFAAGNGIATLVAVIYIDRHYHDKP
jgi:hypothetical protein